MKIEKTTLTEKHARKDGLNDKEYLKERTQHVNKNKAEMHKLIDELEGAVAIVNVRFNKKDKTKAIGSHQYILASGGVHDIHALSVGLLDARASLIKDAVNAMNGKEALHLMSHLQEDLEEEK